MAIKYCEEIDAKNEKKLKNILTNLPVFLNDFFRGINSTTSSRTRIVYAYDLKNFFYFAVNELRIFKPYKDNIQNIDVTLLDKITLKDIEDYIIYIKFYIDENGKKHTNSERGISQKLAALRSMFKYFQKHQIIHNNPTLLASNPKIHDKVIIKMDNDEVNSLIDYIKNCGSKLTGQKKIYYEKNKERDLMIIVLMLNTGIRVSECVGLNINDVNLRDNCIRVTRKGGNEMLIYFDNKVADMLKKYITDYRNKIENVKDKDALFLSIQKTRIGVRSVEKLVKEYTSQVITNKKITPHKFRSTYGTALYKATGDIYLVADVLGHKDINTTQKHYACIDDDRRKSVAGKVKW